MKHAMIMAVLVAWSVASGASRGKMGRVIRKVRPSEAQAKKRKGADPGRRARRT
jgi:hypothetical protein